MSRITTGFSKPYVATYTYASGTGVTYASPTILARGVDISISPETTDDNKYYADNAVAETEAGTLTGGTVSLNVDGLDTAAAKLIFGTPTADTEGWTAYGKSTVIPDVALGYIARTQSNGVVKYVPTVIARVVFKLPETSAATGEDSISWQNQALEATIKRSECSNADWKYEGAEYTTEAAAETALTTFLASTIA